MGVRKHLTRLEPGRLRPLPQPWRTAVRTAHGLALASHPGPTAAVTATMTALAIAAGRGASAAWVSLAVLAGQLSVGWSNDYVDRHRDRLAGRDTKPVGTGVLAPNLVGAAALLALVAAVGLSFASGWRAAIAHIAGIAAAWAYNLGLKATVVSPVPYALAFGLLPAFVTLGLDGHPWPAWWATAAGALLGIAAHFTNVLADIPEDIAADIRGAPHRLGATGSRLVSAGALVVASVLLIMAPGSPGWPPGRGLTGFAAVAAAAAVVVAGIAIAAASLRTGSTGSAGSAASAVPAASAGRAAFRVTVVVAVADVALLIVRGGTLH